MLNPDKHVSKPRQSRVLVELFRMLMPLLVLASGVAAMIVLSNMREAPALERPRVTALSVRTTAVEPHPRRVDIEVDGMVVPHREIDLAAEVSGRVKFKADDCQAGNFVTMGTLLLEIDPADYQLEVRRLAKQLAQAKVAVDELDVQVADVQQQIELAEEDLRLQKGELDRLRSLSGNRFVTDSKVDQAARAQVTVRNTLVKLQNQLRGLRTSRARLVHGQELVETQLEKAGLDLRRTKVIAPVDGVIVQEMVEQDSYVQLGTALVKIEDISAVEVKCNLRMSELYWVWQQKRMADVTETAKSSARGYQLPPTPVTVVFRLHDTEHVWDGVLSRHDGIGLDERTRTVPCRVVVNQPRNVRLLDGAVAKVAGPSALVRGMFVTVMIHTRPETELLKIRDDAVRPGNTVWRVEAGRAYRRKARVAQVLPDGILIEAEASGFAAGDRIVVTPMVNAFDGIEISEKTDS